MAFPPGPRWPALFQTFALLRSHPRWMARNEARYGDLFTIRTLVFGPQVVTSDPELIRQIFTGDPEVLHAGEANSSAKLLTGERSVLTLDDAPHRRARRLLMPPFHGERLHAYAAAMAAITERISAAWKADEPFPLLPSFQRIAIEVIVANVFGLPEGPRRDLFSDRLSALMNLVASPAGIFFLLPALQRDLGPLYPWRRLKAQFDVYERQVYEEIAARRAQLAEPVTMGETPKPPGAERPDDILSLLLEARDEDGQGMPDEEIRDQLVTLVAGGQETTASSLAWAFERILGHPEVYDKLVAEIDGAKTGNETTPADLAKLEYLDATVKEVLRQRPSVPMIGRRLTRPMVLRDHEIPARAMVSPNIYLTHRRADLYPEPEAFRPERFLGKKTDPYTYLPFGGGPRRCLGAAFATLEMKVVVGTVLQRFRLKLARPGPLSPSQRSFFFAPEGGTEVVLVGRRPGH